MGGSSGIAFVDNINPLHQDENAGVTVGNFAAGVKQSATSPDFIKGAATVAAVATGAYYAGEALAGEAAISSGAGAYDAATYSGTLSGGADYAALGVGSESAATAVIPSGVAAGAPYSAGILGADTSFAAAGIGAPSAGVGTASAAAASSSGGFWSTLGTTAAQTLGVAGIQSLLPKQPGVSQPTHVALPGQQTPGTPGIQGPPGANSGGVGSGTAAKQASILGSLGSNPVLLIGAAGALIYYFKKVRR